jgi:hypothetical protein
MVAPSTERVPCTEVAGTTTSVQALGRRRDHRRLAGHPLAVGLLQHLVGLAVARQRGRDHRRDEDGVAAAVVDPALAEHRVLHRADQQVVGALERGAPVGQRHLQHRAVAGADEQHLDADLAGRVVQAERRDLLELCGVALEPRLARRPGRQGLELRRDEFCLVEECHAAIVGGTTDVGHRGPGSCQHRPGSGQHGPSLVR